MRMCMSLNFQRQGCPCKSLKVNLIFQNDFSVSCIYSDSGGAFDLLLCLSMAVAAQAMGVFLFNLDVIHALDHVDWTFTREK